MKSAGSLSLLALWCGMSSALKHKYVGQWDANHEANHSSFSMLAAQPMGATTISRTGWTITCDSSYVANPCSYAIDGNTSTFWHTDYANSDPPPPHMLTVDMKTAKVINGISSLPRQDDNNHGVIAQHQVFVSTDGKTWGNPVAFGNWYNDATEKYANFEPVKARYVRLVALSDVTGDPWTSCADFNVYQAPSQTVSTQTGVGKWGPTIDFPVIPVAGAVEPTSGKLVVWSAYKYDDYLNSPGGYTLTAEYDWASGNVTERDITNTDHDMFCPGISMDGNGQIVVTGGDDAQRTSIFDSASDSWISGPNMIIARGYQASATTSEGRVFTIGGSWSGGIFEKDGEIYDPVLNNWTMLPNALVAPMLTNDPQGTYRADNHGWLFGWKNGTVFQAGPSSAMNWYYTSGSGNVKPAGLRNSTRGTDPDSMCGNAVMFDAPAGKILTVGGSTAYQDADANANAHIITLGAPGTRPNVVFASNGMYYPRIFANAVILPNGHVFITGGQQYGIPFSDTTPDLTPELYMPETDQFIMQAPNSIVRVYHSIAMLLPDGTIFNGGGGLCGNCTTNHFDAQIFTPQYLLNTDGSAATRPTIASVGATSIKVGGTLTFKTGGAITAASFLRYGTVTHATDTDQRRVPLNITSTGTNSFSAPLPTDPGILLPGYWMLFVMNSAGVPSIAATIKVTLT